MEDQQLIVEVGLQIGQPAPEVFEAIVDPGHMSNYFISKGSGRMEEGKRLVWKFPEFEEEAPVRVGKIEKERYISFFWEHEGEELLVEIQLVPKGNSTLVRVTEKGMANNGKGIKWLKGNTEGWANFLACLKAYLEFGINLRKGGFDFLKPS